MTKLHKVYEDERGIYVRVNGGRARPGDVNGYDHAYDMSSGNLKADDKVIVRNVNQSILAKVIIPSTQKLLMWTKEY